MFRKLLAAALKHKCISAAIILAVGGGGYYLYHAHAAGSVQTRYVLAAAQTGTIISSVTGTGQISATDQLDVKAKASAWTLTRMAAYMIANSAMSDVPIVGWAMDTLFRGQFMAATALQKDIEARYGPVETTVDAPFWRSVTRPAL